jgi:hypothetical protein
MLLLPQSFFDEQLLLDRYRAWVLTELCRPGGYLDRTDQLPQISSRLFGVGIQIVRDVAVAVRPMPVGFSLARVLVRSMGGYAGFDLRPVGDIRELPPEILLRPGARVGDAVERLVNYSAGVLNKRQILALYYQSSPWKGYRLDEFKRADGRCEWHDPTGKRCQNKACQIHHESYRHLFAEIPGTETKCFCDVHHERRSRKDDSDVTENSYGTVKKVRWPQRKNKDG